MLQSLNTGNCKHGCRVHSARTDSQHPWCPSIVFSGTFKLISARQSEPHSAPIPTVVPRTDRLACCSPVPHHSPVPSPTENMQDIMNITKVTLQCWATEVLHQKLTVNNSNPQSFNSFQPAVPKCMLGVKTCWALPFTFFKIQILGTKSIYLALKHCQVTRL